METTDHLRLLGAETTLFAETVARTPLDAPVPTCPDWAVRDLVTHTGETYRWAARALRGEQSGFPESWPAVPDEEALAWYRAGAADLLDLLAATPPDRAAWTFWPVESAVGFWARRMANETAIHRVDAQRASGRPTPVDAAQAADGIDELLTGLLALRPRGVRVDGPVRLAVVPDEGGPWMVTLSAERIAAVAGRGESQLTVSGPASQVFTWLWNRGGDVRLDGDRSVAELWQKVRVRI